MQSVESCTDLAFWGVLFGGRGRGRRWGGAACSSCRRLAAGARLCPRPNASLPRCGAPTQHCALCLVYLFPSSFAKPPGTSPWIHVEDDHPAPACVRLVRPGRLPNETFLCDRQAGAKEVGVSAHRHVSWGERCSRASGVPRRQQHARVRRLAVMLFRVCVPASDYGVVYTVQPRDTCLACTWAAGQIEESR